MQFGHFGNCHTIVFFQNQMQFIGLRTQVEEIIVFPFPSINFVYYANFNYHAI